MMHDDEMATLKLVSGVSACGHTKPYGVRFMGLTERVLSPHARNGDKAIKFAAS